MWRVPVFPAQFGNEAQQMEWAKRESERAERDRLKRLRQQEQEDLELAIALSKAEMSNAWPPSPHIHPSVHYSEDCVRAWWTKIKYLQVGHSTWQFQPLSFCVHVQEGGLWFVNQLTHSTCTALTSQMEYIVYLKCISVCVFVCECASTEPWTFKDHYWSLEIIISTGGEKRDWNR